MNLTDVTLANATKDEFTTKRGRPGEDLSKELAIVKDWLRQTQADGGKAVEIPGTWEPIMIGGEPRLDENREPRKSLRGDAAQLVRLLNRAATELNLGVSKKVTPARKRGMVRVAFVATKRKQYTKKSKSE